MIKKKINARGYKKLKVLICGVFFCSCKWSKGASGGCRTLKRAQS